MKYISVCLLTLVLGMITVSRSLAEGQKNNTKFCSAPQKETVSSSAEVVLFFSY